VAKPGNSGTSKSFFGNVFGLLKQTFQEWLQDKAPQLGAALAYYTVFSLAPSVYLIFDFAVTVLLFAMIFKILPDAKIQWRDVWIGALMTAILFGIGKWVLGLYLGSGAAGSAYGPASSLITVLLWVYYSSQILLFGAEFTQVYADQAGREVKPNEYAVRVETKEVEKR
jgi:membrane protein